MIDVETFGAAKKYADEHGGGGGGTTNYNALDNKPQVNGVELSGNKTASDLGLVASVEGKGLSTNDYSDTEKGKVADNTSAIEAMVNVNGAKNRLNLSLATIQALNTSGTWSGNAYTTNGVTYTVNSDMSITITINNQSRTENALFNLDMQDWGTGLCDLVASDTLNGWRMTVGLTEPITGFVSLYNSSTYFRLYMRVEPSATFSTLTVKPMIYDARISDSTYASYAMTNRELTEKVERGSVSVTADGVKTYSQLFYSLITSADLSKITKDSCVSFGNLIFRIARIETNDYRFGLVTLSGTNVETYAIVLNATSDNSCKFFISKTSSNSTVAYNDASATVISSGSVLSLYY